MPSVIIIAPCHFILRSDDGTDNSIISIIEGVKVGLQPNSPAPPAGTIIPFQWRVFVCWKQEPGDPAGEEIEHRLIIKSPDGRLMMEAEPQRFKFDTRMVNVIHHFRNFPIWRQGICPVVVQYRIGDHQEWHDAASFPLLIEHEIQPQGPPSEKKNVVWHSQ